MSCLQGLYHSFKGCASVSFLSHSALHTSLTSIPTRSTFFTVTDLYSAFFNNTVDEAGQYLLAFTWKKKNSPWQYCLKVTYLEYVYQIRSVSQSCPTLCDPMNRSTPGLPVHHQLPDFTQTHVHWVSDAIQPPHPLSSPSPPAPNPSQHQSLFQWVNFSHEVAKVLEFQL